MGDDRMNGCVCEKASGLTDLPMGKQDAGIPSEFDGTYRWDGMSGGKAGCWNSS